jgi:hypothetical protein
MSLHPGHERRITSSRKRSEAYEAQDLKRRHVSRILFYTMSIKFQSNNYSKVEPILLNPLKAPNTKQIENGYLLFR